MAKRNILPRMSTAVAPTTDIARTHRNEIIDFSFGAVDIVIPTAEAQRHDPGHGTVEELEEALAKLAGEVFDQLSG